MNNSIPPPPRKVPKQERSTRMFRAIVDACKKILEEHGEKHLSIGLLEKVSGVSKGSIYDYFPNLEAIIAATFNNEFKQFVEDGLRKMDSHKADTSLRKELTFLTLTAIDWHRRTCALHTGFYHRYSVYCDASSRYTENFDDSTLIKEYICPLIEKEYNGCITDPFNAGKLVMEIFSGLFFSALRNYPDIIFLPGFQQDVVDACCRPLDRLAKRHI